LGNLVAEDIVARYDRYCRLRNILLPEARHRTVIDARNGSLIMLCGFEQKYSHELRAEFEKVLVALSNAASAAPSAESGTE
jgi:hypothetical protein